MFSGRYKYIRTTLNNKARDVIKTDRFRWFKTFKGFKVDRLYALMVTVPGDRSRGLPALPDFLSSSGSGTGSTSTREDN
jgi:hypothetical protein